MINLIRLDGRGVRLCLDRLLRRSHRIDKVEELLHPSDFERVLDPFVHSDQEQTAPILLVGDVSAYQGPNAGRIHVGNIG